MDDKQVVEKTSEGVFVLLTDDGDRVPLFENAPVSFEHLAGARVDLVLSKDRVTCRAKVPESSGEMWWLLDISQPNHEFRGESLENMIYQTRVALNGRL